MLKRTKRLIKKIAKFSFFGVALALLLIAVIFAYFAKDLPDPTKINQRNIAESTKIYDRTGQVILYDIHDEEKRTIIPTEEIPQFVKDATIVIEDDNFYHHFGIDWKGFMRAVWSNLKHQEIGQGGSTITQQYIKNAYLGGPSAERTFVRKIKEAILALELEQKYSKEEILGFYLNQIPYGSNAYGIEAAAQTFFNKSARDLTLAESALLAALPQAPSFWSPFGSHPEELRARQHYILDRMAKFGYVNAVDAEQAKQQELIYAPQGNLKAHHFVTMIQEYLEEKYGRQYIDINTAGLKVYTTLDWDLQQLAEEIVSRRAEENSKKYRAENAALVAIDPKTGQVIALVGSKSYAADQFNVATSPYRQPGSSFKPIVYAMALTKGYTPETVVFDLTTNFGTDNQPYTPHNYDLKVRGPVTLRNALAQSLNIPAVKVLYLAGMNDTINLAHDLGITTLNDRNRYGLSLVLGGGEIKLIDETAAYGVFAADGVRHPVATILKIEDSRGNVMEQYTDQPKKILEVQIARQINSILSDNQARAPMFGTHSSLVLAGRPAAAKTGTTQDNTDGWTLGYTPSLVTGVWTGNNDFNKKMTAAGAGIAAAGPIWHEFMTRAYELKNKENNPKNTSNYFALPEEPENFAPPEEIKLIDKPMFNGKLAMENKVKIDTVSGKLATDLTPPDLIQEKTYYQVHSILYYINQDDPQFDNWENPVRQWALSQPCTAEICYNQNPPSQYDDIHTQINRIEAEITSPTDGYIIQQPINSPVITIRAQINASLSIKQVDFFFNNQLIDSDTIAPYAISFNFLKYLNPESTQQIIKIRAYDSALNRQEDEVIIYLNN